MQHIDLLYYYYLSLLLFTIHVSRKMSSRGLGVAVFFWFLLLFILFSSLIMVCFLVSMPVYYAYMFWQSSCYLQYY